MLAREGVIWKWLISFHVFIWTWLERDNYSMRKINISVSKDKFSASAKFEKFTSAETFFLLENDFAISHYLILIIIIILANY